MPKPSPKLDPATDAVLRRMLATPPQMAIDPKDILKRLNDNNVAVLEFAGETYKRIYG
jgi:hypothetical protein